MKIGMEDCKEVWNKSGYSIEKWGLELCKSLLNMRYRIKLGYRMGCWSVFYKGKMGACILEAPPQAFHCTLTSFAPWSLNESQVKNYT